MGAKGGTAECATPWPMLSKHDADYDNHGEARIAKATRNALFIPVSLRMPSESVHISEAAFSVSHPKNAIQASVSRASAA